MIACFVSTLIALACAVLAAGFILPGPMGVRTRRWSFGLFAAAFLPGVVVAVIRDAWEAMTQSPAAMITGVITLAVISTIAFAILELRRYVTSSPGHRARRVVEKKPVTPRTASDDVVSFLRDRLRGDEPEGRDE